MQPTIPLFGFVAIPADFLFVALGGAWILALAARRAPFVFDRFYVFLGLYLLAMLGSADAAEGPFASAAKLATQLYLLSLPVTACSIVRDKKRVAQRSPGLDRGRGGGGDRRFGQSDPVDRRSRPPVAGIYPLPFRHFTAGRISR